MPAGAQDACRFAEKTLEVGVDVRGLDVDHRIKGFVREGQVLGVALHEIQAGQLVPLPAEVNGGRVEVQPRVGGGMHRPYKVGGSAPMATADFQHFLAAEIDLACGLVVELNAAPVGLVGLVERQTHRRVFLVAPVQEDDVLLPDEPTGHQGIPVLEDLLVGRGGPDAVHQICADVVQLFKSNEGTNHGGKYSSWAGAMPWFPDDISRVSDPRFIVAAATAD